MTDNQLTDKDFWLKYWESKEGLVFQVPDNYPFVGLIKNLVEDNQAKTLLEVGGFPGYYSVWAKKNLKINTTLLDFVIHQKILHELEAANQIDAGAVDVLEVDLFNYQPNSKYDLVMSNGLIEHFRDTKDIISKHVAYLQPGGTLFISLPNFRGLNGWFQKTFDPENYEKHYIESMDLGFLKKQCEDLGLSNIQTYYSGYFMLWLENIKEQPFWVQLFKKALWLPLKVFFAIAKFNTRAFSPYIVVLAKKGSK